MGERRFEDHDTLLDLAERKEKGRFMFFLKKEGFYTKKILTVNLISRKYLNETIDHLHYTNRNNRNRRSTGNPSTPQPNCSVGQPARNQRSERRKTEHVEFETKSSK